ncbi:helix-turn-helix transcriptional regulator [Streptomyces sp. NPDC060011]|uniref:helix-turn-helix transcriptional regulator n=1 Tax=Streptomyces sp. NPDC060011 TaxID=3347037 RepID=UPI00368011C3
MSPETPATPVGTIAKRIKELRARRGWTAEKLGVEVTRHGAKFDRFTISNLENGKRQNVTVDELLAFAMTFDVAPIHLMVPLHNEPYLVTVDRTEDADRAREWIRGSLPLAGMNVRTYYGEASEADLIQRTEAVSKVIETGPFPADELIEDKIAREGRRMRHQNREIAEWEKGQDS